MVGAVEGCLFGEVELLDAGKETVGGVEEAGGLETAPAVEHLGVGLGVALGYLAGYMAGKGWQDGGHAKFALAGKDFALQVALAVDPRLGQGAAEGVKVGHAVPGEVCGAAEVGAYLVVGHPHLAPHLLPHGFLTREGKGHVDSVEGHPVNEAFPLGPLPPRHGVAIGAVIEEETQRHIAPAHNLVWHTDKVFG